MLNRVLNHTYLLISLSQHGAGIFFFEFYGLLTAGEARSGRVFAEKPQEPLAVWIV